PARPQRSPLSLHDALPILAVPQAQEISLSSALFFLGKRKIQIDQILSDSPRESFTEDIKIFEHLFFRERQKSFPKFGFLFFFRIDRKSTRLNSSHVSISYA